MCHIYQLLKLFDEAAGLYLFIALKLGDQVRKMLPSAFWL